MKNRFFLVPLILILMAGCSTVAPGSDPILVNAQRTAQSAHQTFDLLFKVERENEAYVKRYAPSVHDGVNAIRRQAPQAEDNLWEAIEAYRTNRTAENKASLNTYLATLQKLLDEAAQYTQTIQSKTAP